MLDDDMRRRRLAERAVAHRSMPRRCCRTSIERFSAGPALLVRRRRATSRSTSGSTSSGSTNWRPSTCPRSSISLDAWHRDASETAHVACVTQGDYWSANLLCTPDRLVGVIDWDDARVVPCLSEAAWASWNLSGGNRERFRLLLAAYADEDGLIELDHFDDAVHFLRVRLRDVARRAIAIGCPPDHPYFLGLVESFTSLAP